MSPRFGENNAAIAVGERLDMESLRLNLQFIRWGAEPKEYLC
jgi:hypothetical protein